MELSELTLRQFADLLASDAPAPGGGSAAGVCGAIGASLSSMVCALTLGRKKYAESQELAQAAMAEAQALKDAFLAAMERDTAAYSGFGAVLALPKGTEEEKTARLAAMQEAMVECTRSPLHLMELCVKALELTASLVGKTNQNAMSDLGVSALSLDAAIQGAWLNVLTNLGSLKDPEQAAAFRQEGQELLEKGLALSGEIYQSITEAM